MSGASAPSLLGFHPHTHPHPHPHPHRYTHSRISHSDPSYHRSSPSSTTSNLYSHPSTGTSSHIHPSTHPESGASEAGTDSVSSSSKRPFPFAGGSQERDKRARSCDAGGNHRNTWDGAAAGPSRSAGWTSREGEPSGSDSRGQAVDNHEQEVDVDSSVSEVQPDNESSYTSAAESHDPTPAAQSFALDSYPMEPWRTSPVPRIPTPAALRSPSPLLASISTSTIPNQSTLTRLAPLRSPSASGLDRLPPLSMHVLTGDEGLNQDQNQNEAQPTMDMGWLDEALPMPRGLEPFTSTTTTTAAAAAPIVQESTAIPNRHGSPRRPLRALPGTRRVRSPPPVLGVQSNRNSVVGFGSSSVDSALPTSASVGGRMPLPWVDLEVESGSGSSSGMERSTGSGMLDSTVSRMLNSAVSQALGSGASRTVDSTASVLESGSDVLGGSLSPIVNGPASPSFGELASPMGESITSTVQSGHGSISAEQNNSNAGLSAHTELTTAGHSAAATFGSPSTSGSSGSTRTTPSVYTRRPPPTLSLRGFPTSPSFSATSGSPSSFIQPESPTFPVSASPRTSTFDLAVTPPGSALPSFVARMLEVDSPVREGGDHAYPIPELVLEPRAENDAASIDALRRFASGGNSYFTDSIEPEIHREPIRLPLGALGSLASTTEDLTARALRQLDEPQSEPALFPPPREASEIAQPGSSAFSSSGGGATNSTGTVAHHPMTESWASRPLSELGSAYSQRLTESGASYPSRPSASDTSFPSFRANVSPGPELNMGSRPGRVVRDMSWSFSDVFNGQPAGHESSRLEESQQQDDTRAGVRSALSRAARLPGPASLPRLHLNALPRVSNGEDEQSQVWSAMTASNSTNLSRTPPGIGGGPVPNEHDSNLDADSRWIEDATSSSRPPPPPRRMSSARWTDLFDGATSVQPVAVPNAPHPLNRPRPPAIPISSVDSTLFDPLSGMNWSSDTHSNSTQVPFTESPQPQPRLETRQESAQDSFTRYQTFAQSIDELRRSPPVPPPQANPAPNPWGASNVGAGLRLPPVIAPSTTTALSTGLDTARTESSGLGGISNWFDNGDANNSRPPWAMPRPDTLPMLEEPRRPTRNPYNHNIDTRQPPPPPPAEPTGGPVSQPAERANNWLREWERERDRRSRVVREDYWQRRETESAGGSSIEPQRRRATTSDHRSLAQMSETQTQGRTWDEYGVRHEPQPWAAMPRSGLGTTVFGEEDPSNEWSNNGTPTNLWGNMPRRPPRRSEVLPPRTTDADLSAQFSEADANRISDLPFTESPPSISQDFIDMGRDSHYYNGSFSSDVFQSFQRTNSQRAVPESTTPDFRLTSDALRRSLANHPPHARDSSSRPAQARGLSNRRFFSMGEQPVQSQPGSFANQSERPRLSIPRDRWESHQARPQSQLDRTRPLLQSRPGEARDREGARRRLTDLGRISSQAPRRRSFMSSIDPEPISPTSLEPSRHTQWPRESDTQPERPFLRHDRSSWSSTDNPSRNSLQELLQAATRVRRRRTLLPESSSRRGPSGFIHSMDQAINQVESGLLQLSALAGESSESMRRFGLQADPVASPMTHEDISSTSRMDWAYDQPERNSPPPRLPPFEFSQLQRNVDWPSSRRNIERRYEEEDEMFGGGSDRATHPRGLSNYPEHRPSARNPFPRTVHPTYEYDSWRGEPVGAEAWSNEVTPSSVATSMPMRDRVLFRASAPSRDPPDSTHRGRVLRHPDSGSSSTQPPQPLTSFARLHRRRPSSPNVPPPAPTSPSPPRSYTSRLSNLLPRRRGTSNSDDNDEWAHPGSSSGRMFFLRPRGRGRPTSGGDFLRDDEFDDSYEGLLRLAARIGDAKPRGTPSEVIQAMPTGKYATCQGAKAETRCPICLDDYEQEDVVALIKGCSHWFHKDCIQQWLGDSRTCPVCRGQVDAEGSNEPEAGPSSNVGGNMWS